MPARYSAATRGFSIRLFSRSRSSHSPCHSEGRLDGFTCTAVTLYSGQLVAQSEFSVVMTLAPLTGKWNVVCTTPGGTRSLILTRSVVPPVRLVTDASWPSRRPRTSASLTCISRMSSWYQTLLSVRRVCAPTLYWLRMRPVVRISGKREFERSGVGTNSVSMNRPLPRVNSSMCITGVPSGASSLHGHCTLPNSSSFLNEMFLKVGVTAAISSMMAAADVYIIG